MLRWDAQNVAEPHNGGAPKLYVPAELGADLCPSRGLFTA